ncbi:Chromosome partition protein Smc [Lacunisphaera limnophila]|uniref:Chromosome partition protein Smc n=1 Tax=Lacunisphaera limnophila TaxID=1838286 RepID=A0A1D8AZ92_9BACT|nr:chromosome segregation protein SMC [Lacunisphaera limnophila]AOS46210.1 Chromosome partition protein Smc [Lacunisphaera limnophila]
MHLKALKLHGFKSFADNTTLSFQPGVTAIVGPNGCGKSNIADAIRWVLGEQSAKALRGGKMQDVIFEGADTRKPAQFSEVALLLTDCEKQLGSEFHEIEIMRRVSRDGQGEYYFNGQPCRLKDIHKLFMDTGVGRTSYSIMAQGQIDQILSSKPEERRVVFEEAAGITKYKSQRREAMNKLALTEQNLARVSDVINEVARQIGSLKRQAAKAMRFKRLSFRLRHLALAHGHHQWLGLSTTLAGLEGCVAGLRGDAEARRSALDERTRALDEQKAARMALTQRVQDSQQAVFDLRSQKEQAENQSGLAQVKRTGLIERLDAGKDDMAELEMQLRELASQVDTGSQDKQMQLSLLGSSDAVFQDRNRELAVLEGELTRAEQQLSQEKFALLQVESTVARLRTDSSGLEVDARTSQNKYDQLSQDLAQLRSAVEGAASALAEASQKVQEARIEQSRSNNEAQAAQTALQEATHQFREAQRRLQEIDRGLAQKTARLKLLQQLQEKWEGFGEGAKALLQGRFTAVLGEQKFIPITQGLEVRPQYAKAVEALLGASVEAIAVSDLATAQKILGQLEADQVGSVCLQVSGLTAAAAAADGLPSFLSPATAMVANLDAAHPAASVLSACYLTDDLNGFLDFWRANPAFSFLMVATAKGDLVDRRGLIYGGHHKKPANSIVQREVDLRETGKAVVAEQAAHDEQRALIDRLNAVLAEAEATLEQKRKDVLAASQHAAALHTEEKNAQRSLDDASTRLQRMENELTNLKRDHDEALARLAKAQAQLAEVHAAVEAQKLKITGVETAISEKRADRDQKRESLAQARLELAERRQKVEVLDRGLTEMERRRVQLADLHDQRQIEIETWGEQIAALEQEGAGQRARAEEIAVTLAVAQENVENSRRELSAVEQEINRVESGLSTIRTEAEAAMTELSRNEVKAAETKARVQFLTEEINHEFQTDIALLDWKKLLWHADDEPEGMKDLDLDEEETEEGGPKTEDPAAAEAKPKRRKKKENKGDPTEADLAALETANWAEIKAEVDALRQRIGTMGAVNLVAIEEYSELKQRYEFLKTQSDDLTNAKAALLKAIDDINQTSLEQFKVTFEQIRKNFAYTFNILFGGGRAEIDLVTAEDPLESGIEIVAQPPGTKLKGITLLSGGQKTLTAVALLFALYMVKPSPFCLLDELDAPLDESNIHRFTNLLKQFVKESQFIIITHNKSTVAAADALYGVTMQERGVSKTVSMRFNAERGEAEALPTTIADSVRGAAPQAPA